ncbi:hypothetical protein DDR33_15815 [Pararcticibacter amylolyticus]|uniref:Uncharacterized protein n=1 Tax=Pararcticibacter amylolyticus TaxID=2173175 RepID=A0A2U2PDR6_9SPHI|nr:PD-(D/E)XK nuclease family transposase [Pararcticibacter amylolyticus]PWG79537.1 hypothetical protein DDR33_15815 [Pararcticibacter amylolyticus]
MRLRKIAFNLCTGDAGERFLIEVQLSKQKHFRERALFYTSKLIVAQAPKGFQRQNRDIYRS